MDYSAYIAGVLLGDGWCTTNMGLHVKDYDFALEFAKAINTIFKSDVHPSRDGKYWRVEKANTQGMFNYLKTFKPETNEQYCAWLRGLSDSEGSFSCVRMKISDNSVCRKIIIYNSNEVTLETAQEYFSHLGIKTSLKPITRYNGHHGDKQMYGLFIDASLANYTAFKTFIGSSIKRKTKVLNFIISSYRDMDKVLRVAQKKGPKLRLREQ